jgi:hypothetical protein
VLAADEGGSPVPVCVIAKERVLDTEDDALEAGLTIGLKRAALRRALFDVVTRVRGTVLKSFDEAADSLFSVPPEMLQTYVFDPGYIEGVSELHVVQRILSAQMGQDIRAFFGTDSDALQSSFKIRELRAIPLKRAVAGPNDSLSKFRQAEIWEGQELINNSYSPIACGDVFEFDQGEKLTRGLTKRFVVLAQPCDIALRPDGKRSVEAAFLVAMQEQELIEGGAEREITSPKVFPVPFKIEGKRWICDFRNMSVVCVPVLDLASFRQDGRVRVDNGDDAPVNLLASQQAVYKERTAAARAVLAAGTAIVGGGQLAQKLQLCLRQESPFKKIFSATFVDSVKKKPENDPSDNKRRLTWHLRRLGRIREPYIGALLEKHIGLMGRYALDIDFMALSSEVPAEGISRRPEAKDAASAEQAKSSSPVHDTANATDIS